MEALIHFAIRKLSDFNPFGSRFKLNCSQQMLVPKNAWCKTHFTIEMKDRNLKNYEHPIWSEGEKVQRFFESMMKYVIPAV